MDTAEREALKNEIMQELEKKYTGVTIKKDTQHVLRAVIDKWFKNKKYRLDKYSESLMAKAFGLHISWVVWDAIRKLTCIICGVGYVRNLEDSQIANEIAEALCQFVYDLRIKYSGGEKDV